MYAGPVEILNSLMYFFLVLLYHMKNRMSRECLIVRPTGCSF